MIDDINLDNEQYTINIVRLPDNMFNIELINVNNNSVVSSLTLYRSFRYTVFYMDKFSSSVKGCGKILLDKVLDHYSVWFICRLDGNGDLDNLYRSNGNLLSYYRDRFGDRLGEYNISDSIWGCPASVFYSLDIDRDALGKYVDFYFGNSIK